jgi:hypothetical protein
MKIDFFAFTVSGMIVMSMVAGILASSGCSGMPPEDVHLGFAPSEGDLYVLHPTSLKTNPTLLADGQVVEYVVVEKFGEWLEEHKGKVRIDAMTATATHSSGPTKGFLIVYTDPDNAKAAKIVKQWEEEAKDEYKPPL